MARVSLELIGQAGLGYTFGALDDVEAKDDTFASALEHVSNVPIVYV